MRARPWSRFEAWRVAFYRTDQCVGPSGPDLLTNFVRLNALECSGLSGSIVQRGRFESPVVLWCVCVCLFVCLCVCVCVCVCACVSVLACVCVCACVCVSVRV